MNKRLNIIGKLLATALTVVLTECHAHGVSDTL